MFLWNVQPDRALRAILSECGYQPWTGDDEAERQIGVLLAVASGCDDFWQFMQAADRMAAEEEAGTWVMPEPDPAWMYMTYENQAIQAMIDFQDDESRAARKTLSGQGVLSRLISACPDNMYQERGKVFEKAGGALKRGATVIPFPKPQSMPHVPEIVPDVASRPAMLMQPEEAPQGMPAAAQDTPSVSSRLPTPPKPPNTIPVHLRPKKPVWATSRG
jgi:hypothetical protein